MPFASSNLSKTHFRTVTLETSGSFGQSGISLRIRYLVSCIFNPFEEPLARQEFASETA
jgi:hypothetical protein